MSELPEGWTNTTLKDVLEDFQSGFASGEKDVDGGLKHLRMNNISVEGKLNLDLLRTVPAALASQRHYLSKGDILFCTTNSAKLVGKCCLFDLDGRFAFSNHLTKLRANEAIIAKFLLHYLWLLWKQGEFEHKCKHWVNQSTLPKGELLETEVVLPPLNEQRRIVAKLEKLLSRVDAAQARLAIIPRILKRFRQSVLAAACSGRLTADWREENANNPSAEAIVESLFKQRISKAETASKENKLRIIYEYKEERDSEDLPEGWRFVALGKLCESFDYGTSAKSQPSGHVPVLRMGNIQNGEIDWSDLVYTSDEDEVAKYKLEPQTVLFNRTNSPELVGKTAIYRGEGPAIFAGYLIRVNNFSELDSAYLNYCLNTNDARDFRLSVKTDGVSQSNINAQKLAKFEVPFCPLAEQQEIVRRVEALFKTADALEARYRTAKAHVDKLARSILARAFRGELVMPEAELARLERRDYEPASVLLERIRKERTQAASASGQPRRRAKRRKGSADQLTVPGMSAV